MKSINRFFLCTTWIILVMGQYGFAQTDSEDQYKVEFSKRNLGGPRLGITYLPGNTELVQCHIINFTSVLLLCIFTS
jgi:hypothetical protein